MKTAISSGQMRILLELLEQKDMTPERFQLVQESGMLADLFHPEATVSEGMRRQLQEVLEIPPRYIDIEVPYGALTFASRVKSAGIEELDVAYKEPRGFDPKSIWGRKTRIAQVTFIRVDENLSLAAAEQLLRKERVEAAHIEVLLATQQRLPYLGRKFRLAAIGTQFKYFRAVDDICFPVIDFTQRGDKGLKLTLEWSHRVADAYILGCRWLS